MMIEEVTIFDIEADSLLDNISKIHCLCWSTLRNGREVERGTLIEQEEIENFFLKDTIFVGHNIIGYDFPALEKIFGIARPKRYIDTLGLSWYLYPKRVKHGLESFGEELGVQKPQILDWKEATREEYIYRCQQDVIINFRMFSLMILLLEEIYEGSSYWPCIHYLNWKMECLREQEEVGIALNVEYCKEMVEKIRTQFVKKTLLLQDSMPKYLGKLLRVFPKNPYLKDGSLSSTGKLWKSLIEEKGLPPDTTEVREKPNPSSLLQLKTWLFSLGWKPNITKLSKSSGNQVPQIIDPETSEICSSIKTLVEKEPVLIELGDFYILSHRLKVFEGFLDSVYKDRIKASASGFTNTLRLRHRKPIANMPGVFAPYGKEVRSCLIADEGHIMCGADISGLESATAQHYMYYFDPEYVEKIRKPGYDPHCDLALMAHMLTEEEVSFYKAYEKNTPPEHKPEIHRIKAIRFKAKTTNFASVYGAKPPKLASVMGCSTKEAKKLYDTYWKLNGSVLKVVENVQIRIVRGESYLYNPVSGLWLWLKHQKDAFSTLNQSTGAFVFDTWLDFSRRSFKEKGIKVCLQYHDELLASIPIELEAFAKTALEEAMERLNNELKLNVKIKIDVKTGKNYAEVH